LGPFQSVSEPGLKDTIAKTIPRPSEIPTASTATQESNFLKNVVFIDKIKFSSQG